MKSILIQFGDTCIQSSDILIIKKLAQDRVRLDLKDGRIEWPNDVTYEQATSAYFEAVYKLLKQGE